MKQIHVFSLIAFIIAVFVFAPAQQAHAQQNAYQEAIKLFNDQKFSEALPIFEAILAQKPTNVYARSYATKCKQAIAQGLNSKRDLKAELDKIILPNVAFEEAPIGDVMAYLTQRIEEVSGGKSAPNFIFQGSHEQRQNLTLNINLRNVPVTEVIRYMGQLANCAIKYEEHAVVIDPNRSSETLNASPEPKTLESTTEKKNGTVFGEKPFDPFNNTSKN